MSGSTIVPRLLASRLAHPERVSLEIHPQDEMLLYALELHCGDAEAAAGEYFATALAVLDEVRQLAAWRFGGLEQVDRLLDFASGFGRVTRLLLHDLPAQRIAAADIYADAVRFQGERLGVQALASGPAPGDFTCSERFDFILVSSLFSHLPAGRFEAWFARLVESLAPGGLLALTVHDESLLPTGASLDPSGIAFAPESESRSLETAEYGTSWVSESYVRSAVAAVAAAEGEGLSCLRLPRAHGHFQDLYVVVREGDVDFSPLRFDPGPRGQLDACRVEKGPRLCLGGWAVDEREKAPPARVEIALGDAPPIVLDALGPRQDAPEVYAWAVELPLAGDADAARLPLRVTATNRSGAATVLHAGSVASAALRAERVRGQHLASQLAAAGAEVARLGAERDVLAARLAAAYASRFWKVRNVWFGVKRRLGLTDER